MADHIIYVSQAIGEPYLPPLIDEEYDNYTWISWSRPSSQETVSPDTAFIVKFNRPIDLEELTLSNFQIQRVTDDSPLAVEILSNPFHAMNFEEDYDSLARELVLRLRESLFTLEEYFFVVTNLKDTTGSVQTEDHVVLFSTSGIGTEYDADTDFDIDQVVIEDKTLVSPPLPSGVVGAGSSSVSCNILDGTLHVDHATTEILLYYNEVVDTSLISVLEEELETGSTTQLDIEVVQDPDTFVVTISLPDQSEESPSELLYVRENCIYTVDAIYASFQFTGVLSPFYVPLNSFIPYTTAPSSDPITWARLVWMISKEVEERMGDNALYLVAYRMEAVRNFTKYMILSMTSGTSSNESFMLGELQVNAGQSSVNRDNYDYKSMMDMWEAKLFGYGFTTRTVDVVAPRAQSYQEYSPTAKRYLERRFGTFDRRMF